MVRVVRTIVVLVTVFLCSNYRALAVVRKDFYPFNLPSSQTLKSEPNGQISSTDIKLRTPIVFYDRNFTTVYINGNGLLSFIRPIHRFLNIPFPLDDPVIAPLYTHVDIRGSGTIHFLETDAIDVLSRAGIVVQSSFRDAASFQPTHVLIATWLDVGYYNTKSDRVNTYQAVIASNGTHSYVEFLYPENGIQWIQGEGHPNGLPDAKAQVGIMGEGRYYGLKGSGTDQIQNIDKWSNVNRPGQWVFQIGPLPDGEAVKLPDNIKDHYGQDHIKTCYDGGATRCHSKATCIDYDRGFCCSCKQGFFGNGESCQPREAPLRLIGKVSGNINDHPFSEMDLQCYIQTKDGRTYTALSRTPKAIGASFQLINPFSDIISWLFAKTTSETKNGYELTGGLFNHTLELKFDKTNDKLTIKNKYLGLDVFGQLKVESHIKGTLPRMNDDVRLEYIDHELTLSYIQPGTLRSHTSRKYKLAADPNTSYPFSEDHTIEFRECLYSPSSAWQNSSRVKLSRGVTTYETRESITRFASNAKVVPLEEEDPCVQGRETCSHHSYCIADEDSFRCVCNPGYQHLYNDDGSAICVDINECTVGNHACSPDANCVNSEGAYSCYCRQGFTGDGRTCDRLPSCSETRCDDYEQCVMTGSIPVCTCIPGFEKTEDGCFPVQRIPCDQANDCSPLGICEFNKERQLHVCACIDGYIGDGYNCYPEERGAERHPPIPQCHVNLCWCPPGWTFYDSICIKSDSMFEEPGSGEDGPSCNVLNRCDPYAQCNYDADNDRYVCQCISGYEGDGIECSKIPEGSDCLNVDTCDPNASCRVDEDNVSRCICNSGYKGDGYTCTPYDECRDRSECDINEQCSYVPANSRYECTCLAGYTLMDNQCTLSDCSFKPSQCHQNAHCIANLEEGNYRCTCKKGYYGDGIHQCIEEKVGCSLSNNCGRNAVCAFNQTSNTFACMCLPGFYGNGFSCSPQTSCRHDPNMCSRHAQCKHLDKDDYVCVCKEGYIGDGNDCRPRPKKDSNFLLVNQGMYVHRIPLDGKPGDVIGLPSQQAVVGLNIDCPSRRVYVSDVTGNKIISMNYNGSSVETVIKQVSSPEGIAIDWVSKLLFWTDSAKETVEVAHLVTKKRKVLVRDMLVNPRGIAVHPHRGKLFWSDWNRVSPKIEWSNEDGTSRQVYLQGQNVRLPNALAIDWVSDELCWTDAGTYQISCAQIDSKAVRVVAKNLAYPFGLAISHSNFYWTDWKSLKVEVALKSTGKRVDPLLLPQSGSGKPYGIAVVVDTCPNLSNVCQEGYQQHCTYDQLCLPDGKGGRTCACADNVEGICSDNRS